MQTFLPYADYRKSAQVLDRPRLGKQIVECKQILSALLGLTPAYANHPATVMWKGYEASLMTYMLVMAEEYVHRGYNAVDLHRWCVQMHDKHVQPGNPNLPPPWMGDTFVHASHRSNLLRKNYPHYAEFDWEETDDWPYIWPETHDARQYTIRMSRPDILRVRRGERVPPWDLKPLMPERPVGRFDIPTLVRSNAL